MNISLNLGFRTGVTFSLTFSFLPLFLLRRDIRNDNLLLPAVIILWLALFGYVELDFDVLVQVSKGSTEWAGKGWVVAFEEGTDALVVERVGAWGNEERLTDRYSEQA